MEIFEIYCKIQNRLIFIMRIKTFFFLHSGKKKMLELTLPRCERSRKAPGGIGTRVGSVANSSLQHAEDEQKHRGEGEPRCYVLP